MSFQCRHEAQGATLSSEPADRDVARAIRFQKRGSISEPESLEGCWSWLLLLHSYGGLGGQHHTRRYEPICKTHSPLEHVQKDTLNLFVELIYYLSIYLFICDIVLTPSLLKTPCALLLFSSYPYLKKKQLHLARSQHTTALYTVSLNLECK